MSNRARESKYNNCLLWSFIRKDRKWRRVPCSKARQQDSQTFLQPCMWVLDDGAGQTLCCLGHGELAWLFYEPDRGLDHSPRILLSCFRARTSECQLSPAFCPTRFQSTPQNLFFVLLFLALVICPLGIITRTNKQSECCRGLRSYNSPFNPRLLAASKTSSATTKYIHTVSPHRKIVYRDGQKGKIPDSSIRTDLRIF